MIEQRFEKACARLGLNDRRHNYQLDATQFKVPGGVRPLAKRLKARDDGPQIALF